MHHGIAAIVTVHVGIRSEPPYCNNSRPNEPAQQKEKGTLHGLPLTLELQAARLVELQICPEKIIGTCLDKGDEVLLIGPLHNDCAARKSWTTQSRTKA